MLVSTMELTAKGSDMAMSSPVIYLLSQGIIGAKRSRLRCVKEYICPVAGQRILDVGCGPGYVVEYFPESDYTGFDTDKKYIQYANDKYGQRGRFFCQELDDIAVRSLKPFDLIIMNGLIHHLSDTQVIRLFQRVKRILKPGGKVVTLDGCYVKGQSSIAKKILDCDRGKYVREERAYVDLVSGVFDSVVSHIRHDFMIIPYTLIIMQIS